MATQSLYRRYRPRRFSELKGQDHVVRALRDAVASGRAGQAYLFSGPRGTGKTTSARILAKALNCDDVVDGEPCCACESCLAVERGTSYDVHELDAASNRGIDAMRDLIERTSLGTAGRHKVYILDEVHMLTKEAAAALLKTLEEPPPHVVFVLATTDPQKVIDTIRSRTQHLQFHLLPSDVLAEHVRWVVDDAGLELPQAALDAALVQGGGSARDTLSALEVLASSGGQVDETVDLDGFLVALVEHDPGRALTAMGHAVALGRDPRTVTEDLVRHLRNAFLSLMAPELVVLPSERVDVLAAQAQQLGAAALVRAIERLGTTLTDMRHAPDPRILAEVALVQLTHDAASDDLEVLQARLERLEGTVKQLRESGGSTSGPVDSTGRAVVGGAARRLRPVADAPPTAPPSAPTAAADPPGTASPPAPRPEPEPRDVPPTAGEPAASGAVTVTDAWEQVKGRLKGMARPLFAACELLGEAGDVWRLGVPNDTHRAKCEEHRADVEAELSQAVGAPVSIELVVDGATPPTAPSPTVARPDAARSDRAARASAIERATRAAAAAPDDADDAPAAPTAVELPDDDEIDLSELTDAPPESVKTPIDRLAEAFPGSELMTDD